MHHKIAANGVRNMELIKITFWMSGFKYDIFNLQSISHLLF